uniref:hypothetical protein n=1 Tax=Candidatus Vondammii sp. HM_W22 TaxID=2687299 RepID=UPI001F13401A|nr:hypothetical protein [Candidatus Vondammii sp. HM_W22]
MKDLIFRFCLTHLKKQFHLPARLIDIGNSFRCQFEIVGQEHVMLTCFWIAATDAPRLAWTFICRPDTGKLDGLIAG